MLGCSALAADMGQRDGSKHGRHNSAHGRANRAPLAACERDAAGHGGLRRVGRGITELTRASQRNLCVNQRNRRRGGLYDHDFGDIAFALGSNATATASGGFDTAIAIGNSASALANASNLTVTAIGNNVHKP